MKRTAILIGSGSVVLGILFPLVWAIVRVLSQDFPALSFAMGGLSFVVSLALTAYIVMGALEPDELHEAQAKAARSTQSVSTVPELEALPHAHV